MKKKYIQPAIEIITAYTDNDVMQFAAASYSNLNEDGTNDGSPTDVGTDNSGGNLELCSRRRNAWNSWDE